MTTQDDRRITEYGDPWSDELREIMTGGSE